MWIVRCLAFFFFFFLPPNVCTVCNYCHGLESTLEVFLPPCHSFETYLLRTFCLYYNHDVPFIMYLNSRKWVLLFLLSDFCCFLRQVSLCSPSQPVTHRAPLAFAFRANLSSVTGFCCCWCCFKFFLLISVFFLLVLNLCL